MFDPNDIEDTEESDADDDNSNDFAAMRKKFMREDGGMDL